MHYEIFYGERIDCLQFHVSCSLRAAEKYISEMGVVPYSWWQVHPHVVDHDSFYDGDEGGEVYYYSHTGKRLKAAPHEQAIKAYRREQQKELKAKSKDK